jgi:tetratricopeptide (TPR) repeat protein
LVATMKRILITLILAASIPFPSSAEPPGTDDSAGGGMTSTPNAEVNLDPEMETLSQLAGHGPRWAVGYATRAKELLEKGRRTGESHSNDALTDADRAVALDTNNARFRTLRAEIQSARSNPDAAIADLTVAIGIALSDPEPLNARGVVLARRGDYTAAMADFDAAYENALYNRAYISEKLGNNDQALKGYDEALDVDPNFLVALGARGLLKQRLAKTEEARADLEVAKQLGTGTDDDISRKMSNLVIDALGSGPPGRWSFCSLENVGIALIGPLPGNGDFLKRCSDELAESKDDKESAGPVSSAAAAGRNAPAQNAAPEHVATDEGENLGVDEVYRLLKGNTSDGVMLEGGPYKEFYAADGTIHGKSYEGTWWMKDEQFCTSYPGMKSNCFGVRKIENGAINWVIDGRVVGYGRVISGNHYDY